MVGIVACHHDVTILPPGRPPAVLEQPVVPPTPASAVANDQQRVCQLLSGAAGLTVDPARVELQGVKWRIRGKAQPQRLILWSLIFAMFVVGKAKK